MPLLEKNMTKSNIKSSILEIGKIAKSDIIPKR